MLYLRKVLFYLSALFLQHNQHLADTKDREPDVLWIGDSIIAHLKQRPMWNDLFEPLHSLNFGLSGDTTQNILWRIQNGALDNIKPKVRICLSLFQNTLIYLFWDQNGLKT